MQVHVKNRCAWINHSTNPQAFLQLVQRFSNIKLWFSGGICPALLSLPTRLLPQSDLVATRPILMPSLLQSMVVLRDPLFSLLLSC